LKRSAKKQIKLLKALDLKRFLFYPLSGTLTHRQGGVAVVKRYTTYLAGPMQAITHSGSGWRALFTHMLAKYNVVVQNPVNSERKKTGLSAAKTKSLLKWLAALTIRGDADAQRRFRRLLRRIVVGDFQMVDRCDFIIAQVIEGVVSIGTTAEIFRAVEKRIPVYVIYSGRPEHFSHWLLYYVMKSGGRVFMEKRRNGFKECLDYIRNRFELEQFERRNGYRRHVKLARGRKKVSKIKPRS